MLASISGNRELRSQQQHAVVVSSQDLEVKLDVGFRMHFAQEDQGNAPTLWWLRSRRAACSKGSLFVQSWHQEWLCSPDFCLLDSAGALCVSIVAASLWYVSTRSKGSQTSSCTYGHAAYV